MKEPENTAAHDKRQMRALPVGRLLASVAGPALGKKGGASFGMLVSNWADIVGPDLARRTAPVKLAFPRSAQEKEGATLTLRTEGAAALEVQHASPQILERINSFFGYRAVEKLKLVQDGEVKGGPSHHPPAHRPLTPSAEKDLCGALQGIENKELREALAALGHAVWGR